MPAHNRRTCISSSKMIKDAWFFCWVFFFSHDNLKERLLTDEHTKGKEALVPFGRVLQKPYDKYAKPLSNPASRLFGIVKCVKAMFTLPVTPEYRGHGGGWQYNKMRVLTTLRNQAETCNQDWKAQLGYLSKVEKWCFVKRVDEHGHS